jgi:hypothetical protein
MGEELLTLSELAKENGVVARHADYAARTYGISPARRAGRVKLFRRADVPRILAAMARIAERSTGVRL